MAIGLVEVESNDDPIAFRHEARDGTGLGLDNESAFTRGDFVDLVDNGPCERDVEVRGEVRVQLAQRVARAADEHVELLPPAGLGRLGLGRVRGSSNLSKSSKSSKPHYDRAFRVDGLLRPLPERLLPEPTRRPRRA